jgi:RNA polymerase sigma-70 factor (ECF subfamily)
MSVDGSARQAMLDAIPHLRAFAISLSGNITHADDLVQTALMRGLENLDKFQPGTSMRAWLFTILRNHFYTEARQRRREVADPDGVMVGNLATMPEQGARLDFNDMQSALARLSVEQREAFLLGWSGGSVLRGGGQDLWYDPWHDQKSDQPSAHATCRVAGS